MKRLGIILVLLVIVFSGTCYAKDVNWVHVYSSNGGWDYYYDPDYAKIVNVDGCDILKVKLKMFSPEYPKIYSISMRLYNIDTTESKSLTTDSYDRKTNVKVDGFIWHNDWDVTSQEAQTVYKIIIDKIQEGK